MSKLQIKYSSKNHSSLGPCNVLFDVKTEKKLNEFQRKRKLNFIISLTIHFKKIVSVNCRKHGNAFLTWKSNKTAGYLCHFLQFFFFVKKRLLKRGKHFFLEKALFLHRIFYFIQCSKFSVFFCTQKSTKLGQKNYF